MIDAFTGASSDWCQQRLVSAATGASSDWCQRRLVSAATGASSDWCQQRLVPAATGAVRLGRSVLGSFPYLTIPSAALSSSCEVQSEREGKGSRERWKPCWQLARAKHPSSLQISAVGKMNACL